MWMFRIAPLTLQNWRSSTNRAYDGGYLTYNPNAPNNPLNDPEDPDHDPESETLWRWALTHHCPAR
jgi:hypothetical protein